jgi:hypothetical protein
MTNRLAYRKLKALKQLAERLNIFADNPHKKGEKPYEKEEIFLYFCLLHAENLPKIAFSSITIILDWYLPEWKRFASPEIVGKTISRNDKEVKHWKLSVLRRDNHTCVKCGSKNNLFAHHVCEWSDFPELRIDVDNGETLCGVCHHKEHKGMARELFNVHNN